ncbi:uncharacterized protein LOC109537000 isoform X6 [Dendroctonus ponderosae]|uniref:uncharacterized protein LOC109537000 isoform X6 n=1 Tax=Dendroctonus ponderosae TaxID=77166 RepID=UPI002035F491|nr:uncharacterized protein LOC109537000 isoform X6 [Dendroctonus ponderosae]
MKPIIRARDFLLSVAVILIICDKKVKCFTSEDVANDLKFIKICKSNSPPGAYSMNDVLETKNAENTHSRAFKCFLHCLLTKYGWMDEDGGYLLHDIRETLQQSDVQLATLEYILYTCTAVKSSDRCQRAHSFTECFWKKMDEEQPTADELFYNVKTRK